jgi:hypothetical protein
MRGLTGSRTSVRLGARDLGEQAEMKQVLVRGSVFRLVFTGLV